MRTNGLSTTALVTLPLKAVWGAVVSQWTIYSVSLAIYLVVIFRVALVVLAVLVAAVSRYM